MNHLQGSIILLLFATTLVHFTCAFVPSPSSILRAPASTKISLQEKHSIQTDETTTSSSSSSSRSGASSIIQNYLTHQRENFDALSPLFNSEDFVPPEVVPILQWIVKRALAETISCSSCKDDDDDDDKLPSLDRLRILDVGCGTGALFRHYIDAADEMGVELDITGIDLSPNMIQFATENAKAIVDRSMGNHSITCITGDFVQTVMGVDICRETLTGFDHDQSMAAGYRGSFDTVSINACFGNFHDQNSVLTAAATCLKSDGVLAVTHPLGAKFVAKLGEESPSTVPNRLPSERELSEMIRFQPLNMIGVVDGEATIAEGESTTLYYASMHNKPHCKLRKIVRLRGAVDRGFGRGGKKLGFPTANLPSSLFSGALIDVPTGVYVGFALIEQSSINHNDKKRGRGVIHKAVVNVGYSPTFDGEENKEKIVEAHLITEEGDIEGDFYGDTMRLGLYGFLRPEMKFPSFPDLIQAITNDVATAKASLDSELYAAFRDDLFFVEDEWVWQDGGDNNGSFEFVGMN